MERLLTSTEVAKYLGVKLTKVDAWIKSGQLAAINIASNPNGLRPRYRVSPEALKAFELSRSIVPPAPVQRKRREVTWQTFY